MGYFRDDTPLMELILDEKGQKELDRLWDEFDFIADYTARTWVQYFFNQSGEVQGKGAESGTPRPADHEVTDTAVILALRDAYLAKAAADPNNDPVAPEAIRDHFERVNDTLRALEKEHVDAEPKHLEALLNFAARAYRRPLTQGGARRSGGLLPHAARQERAVARRRHPRFDGQHADVARFPVPHRSARSRQLRRRGAAGFASSQPPLSPYALASRLSYFLWSSMPDEELLAHAAAGDLRKPRRAAGRRRAAC